MKKRLVSYHSSTLYYNMSKSSNSKKKGKKMEFSTGQREALSTISNMFIEITDICDKHNLGDPFNYARSKEMLIANRLGHYLSEEYSGADGYELSGDGAEYKSTIAKKIQATYNGISVQPTWKKQVEYLENDKIGKYPNHYYARFEGARIVEVYQMKADKVLSLLLPKLKRKFNTVKNNKDPRLGATIGSKDIIKYGKKLL